MHIAAMKPESLNIEDLDDSIVENGKEDTKINTYSGKPSNIADKILEGKMKNFIGNHAVSLTYILDQEKNVKAIIDELPVDYKYKISSFELISL